MINRPRQKYGSDPPFQQDSRFNVPCRVERVSRSCSGFFVVRALKTQGGGRYTPVRLALGKSRRNAPTGLEGCTSGSTQSVCVLLRQVVRSGRPDVTWDRVRGAPESHRRGSPSFY
jgi:hypothetical protein